MLRITFILLGFTILFSCTQEEGFQTDSHLQSYFDSIHLSGNFEGTVCISKDEDIIFHKAYGIADRSWKIPMDTSYLFDIASVNKSFIAALIIKAREEGKIQLEVKLNDVIKELFPGDTLVFNESITLNQMLCHSSGIPDYGSVPADLRANNFRRFKRSRFSNKEYLKFISGLDQRFEPGTDFYYSNFSYHILCIILEELYQSSFNEILQKKICQPLGLKHTISSSKNEEIIDNHVQAYNFNQKDSIWYENDFIDLTLGRRIFSTSSDIQKWAASFDSNVLLNKESRSLIRTNQLDTITDMIAYSYGWVSYGAGEHFAMGDLNIDLPYLIHGGETGGYKAMLINIDGGKYIISFLSNIGEKCDEMNISQNIVNIIIDEK